MVALDQSHLEYINPQELGEKYHGITGSDMRETIESTPTISHSDCELTSPQCSSPTGYPDLDQSTSSDSPIIQSPTPPSTVSYSNTSQRPEKALSNQDEALEYRFHCSYKNCSHKSKSRAALNKHINARHNKRFGCDVHGCKDGPFGYRADVVRHKRTAHADTDSEENIRHLRCSMRGCSKQFAGGRLNNFWRHLRKVHVFEEAEARRIRPLDEGMT